jgi:hypothetical protein
VKLPDSVLRAHFIESFRRGMVVRYLMPDPDDPAIQERRKYALLSNLDCEETDSFLLLTTSKIEKISRIERHFPNDFHRLNVGAYRWVTEPTVIDLRKLKQYPRDSLLRSIQSETLTFEGPLNSLDMTEIDQKLRQSRNIERQILRRIVSL